LTAYCSAGEVHYLFSFSINCFIDWFAYSGSAYYFRPVRLMLPMLILMFRVHQTAFHTVRLHFSIRTRQQFCSTMVWDDIKLL